MRRNRSIGKTKRWTPLGVRAANGIYRQPTAAHLLASPDRAASVKLIGKRLDQLAADANYLGLPEHVVVASAMNWAAERTYAAGGYVSVRAAMLDVLETILIIDAGNKDAA